MTEDTGLPEDAGLSVPAGIAWGIAPLDGVEWPLRPDEERAVAEARTARRAEFSAGRHLARRLAARLGLSLPSLPRRADGSPAWPEGSLGSISHCDDLCVVAIARDDRLGALGVDVEPSRPIERDLWPELFTADETRWLDRSPDVDCSRFAFSAKEAYYKAFRPSHVSSFLDLELRESNEGLGVTEALVSRPHRLVARRLGPWLLTVCSAAPQR